MELFSFETMYSALLAGVLGWTFAYTFVTRQRLSKIEARLGGGE